MAGLDPAIHQSFRRLSSEMDRRVKPGDDECQVPSARQFNTLFPPGLSSEKVGTSISKRSPLSLTIW